jgi:V8-like Glu-specific endopeptidase
VENRTKEIDTGHKPIPIDIINTVMKSICKISIKMKDQKIQNGTGFFMNISNTIKYLITNYHVINPDLINEDIEIEIEIWNHKKMKLSLNNYNIKYFEDPKDITVIEIKNSNEIYKDINFLDYDRNYINGYKIYNNVDVFSIEHPFGKIAACASGKIIKIYDYEFDHNISTDNGSSGCPIILLNDNINLIQVIGIHKNADKLEKINGGTFIGEIFKELNNDYNKKKR